MILLFTGNGKGKTTAALGQALRAIGDGKKVLMVQFIKSPEWVTGEVIAAKKLAPNFKIVPMGRGFVGILGDTLPREEHEKAARHAFEYAKQELARSPNFSEGKTGWDVLILDEINVALSLKLLPLTEVLDFLSSFPKTKDLILTGRDAPKELYEYADYVSEVWEVKHPFRKGEVGKRGREY